MRKFINLVEKASGFLPDFRQFVTPQLVNEIFNAEVWSQHGSDLAQWWEEGAPDMWTDEDNEVLEGYDWESARDEYPDRVREVLHRFLIARAGYIERTFTSGDYGIAPITPESPLQRAMVVSDNWIAQRALPQRGALPLGIYWGLEHVEAWGAQGMEAGPHIINVVTRVKDVHINWYETFRSRVDWQNGDEEHEIQLYPGSAIPVERMFIACSDTQPERGRANEEIPIHPSSSFIA